MKILVISDSFKGSLSSVNVNRIITQTILEHYSHIHVDSFPISDGGEGSLDVFKALGDINILKTIVTGPLKTMINIRFGHDFSSRIAYIESSEVIGLSRVPESLRNPLKTTTYGLGELINKALELNLKKIIITLGGSSTNDGGMGMLKALGVKFSSNHSMDIPSANDLAKITDIDFSQLNPKLKDTEIIVLSDVVNPLLGMRGATYTYSIQKGATLEMLETLESSMKHYVNIVEKRFNSTYQDYEGSGAAGGLGFALLLLNAKIVRGIDYFLQYKRLKEKIVAADLVITGEGQLDSQTLDGKVVSGIANLCLKYETPCLGYFGTIKGELNQYASLNLMGMHSIINHAKTQADSIKNAEIYLKLCVEKTLHTYLKKESH